MAVSDDSSGLGNNSSQPTQYTEQPATIPIQIAVLVERVAGLQQVITEREVSARRALELQAAEYRRRLDDLTRRVERLEN